MNKEDFSTTYVPLQPPYQIIKYGKDIGMQIGTMIASRHIEGDGDEAFHIETHSYPVVTYTNKNSVRGNRILFHYSFMDYLPIQFHIGLGRIYCLSLERLFASRK